MEELKKLCTAQTKEGIQVLPQILLAIKIAGARCHGHCYSPIRPKIEKAGRDMQ